MNIHLRSTRIFMSAVAFLVVLFLTWPHLMDVQPPLFVRVLLMPVELVLRTANAVNPPCQHIGTAQHPICEGTPVDLFVGLVLVMLCILLYAAVAYLGLSLASRVIKRREL